MKFVSIYRFVTVVGVIAVLLLVGWMGRVGVLYYDRLVLFCLERCSAGHGACGNCVLYAQKGISADVCLRVVATGKRITYLLSWTADAIEANFAST